MKTKNLQPTFSYIYPYENNLKKSKDIEKKILCYMKKHKKNELSLQYISKTFEINTFALRSYSKNFIQLKRNYRKTMGVWNLYFTI